MYVRLSRSGNRQYLRLVEAYRDEQGKARQRQIAQLGRLDQLQGPVLDGLIDSLRRFGTDTNQSAEHEAAEPQFERARELGATWVLSELWQSLGLSDLLKQALRSSRREYDVEAAVRLMVFNRVCDPDSKLGVLRWLEGVVMPGVETSSITHQHLLRAMDALMAERETIRKGLSRRLLPLLDRELSVVFYDLTSLRVHGEGEEKDDLRQYGKSKELNGVARQCVLGLIQSADGLPLDFEVFEGNVAEVKTLLPMLERCVSAYPIERVIVVADRGLLSLDNVAEVEQLQLAGGRTLEYILAVPAGRYRDFTEVISRLAFAEQTESIRETRWDQRRVVIAHDPVRATEQQARRQKTCDDLIALGQRLADKLDAQETGQSERGRRASDRGAYTRFSRAVYEAHFSRFITPELTSERFAFSVDDKAIQQAERLDGKLVLLTNVEDLAGEDIVSRYKALADIERGFRVLKQDLRIAPMFHYRPDRIKAHAMLCFFALLLHRVMRQRLRQGVPGTSVERALERLKAIQLHQVKIAKRTLRGVTTLTAEQLDLFKHLGGTRPKIDAV